MVLDMVGAPYFARNLECLAPEGRLVQIGVQQGPKAELNLLLVMQKRLTVTGSTLRPRSIEEKGRLAAALREKVWPKIEAGAIRPVIHALLPLAEARRGAPRHGSLGPHRQARADSVGSLGATLESSLKSFIDRFRAQPEWQSPDPAVRAAAVLRLSAEERELLRRLSPKTRTRACARRR